MALGQKTGGRQAGTPNKITAAFKDAVRIVYDDIGGHTAFAEWAKDNRGEFYRIAARLIPTEITRGDTDITFTVNRSCAVLDAPCEQDVVPMLPAKVIGH